MRPQKKKSSGGAVVSRTGGMYIPGTHHSEVGFLEQDVMRSRSSPSNRHKGRSPLDGRRLHGLVSMDFAIARIAP